MLNGKTLFLVFVATVSFSLAHWLGSALPVHMDEVLVHHELACRWAPLNSLGVLHAACGHQDLRLSIPLTDRSIWLPLRSYGYVGSVQSLAYLPLFLVWPDPLSSRMFGLLMLGVQAWCLRALFGLSPVVSFSALLLFFPYSFQHFVDTGQLSLQTTILFLVYLTARRWRESLNRHSASSAAMWSAATGALLGFGIFLRLSFVFVLPGALLSVLSVLAVHRWRRWSSPTLVGVASCCCFLIAWLAPSAALLLSTDIYGEAYYRVLASGMPATEDRTIASFLWRMGKLSQFVLDPRRSAHVLVELPSTIGAWRLYTVGMASVLCLGLVLSWGTREFGRGIALVSAAIVTFCCVCSSPRSWAMHHVVLAYPFLILAAARLLSGSPWKDFSWITLSTAQRGILGILLAIGIYLWGSITTFPTSSSATVGVRETNRMLSSSLAHDHLIVVVDWGMFYVQSLYGPRSQAVVAAHHIDDPAVADRVVKLGSSLGRKLAVVGRDLNPSRLHALRTMVPSLVPMPTSPGTGTWRVMREQ